MGEERTFSGRIWNGRTFEDGYLAVESGIITDLVFGEGLRGADFEGCIMPGIVDTHTHVADSGLVLDRRYELEELVAPPNGLKHRYLRDTDASVIKRNIRDYGFRLNDFGESRYIDFREGGAEGARMLREVSDEAVILGRPVSEHYDANEIDDILSVADGIGIPSITDMDHGYIEAIADHVHRKNKMLALHVSERIREDIDFVISLEPDLIVHMVQATDSDLSRCADNDVPISVCPTSNLYFGVVPPVGRMLDAGVDVSLGTDNGMLFPSGDYISEIRVLADVLASQGKDRNDAFGIALACGHKVLYNEPLILSKTGKRADFTAFPCSEEDILTGGVPGSVRYGP